MRSRTHTGHRFGRPTSPKIPTDPGIPTDPKIPKILSIVILPIALFAWACSGDGGGGGTTQPPTTGTVSGQVSAAGAGVSGATLTLSQGSSSRTTSSAGTGSYSFGSVAAGSWNVGISVPPGFALAAGQAALVPVTVTASQTSTVDFALIADAGGSDVVEIELSGVSFSPSDVTIGVGTKVRWIYRSGGPHTVTPDGHNTWESATLTAPSQVFEHTFMQAGTYAYYCDPHRASGMTGVIRVQ